MKKLPYWALVVAGCSFLALLVVLGIYGWHVLLPTFCALGSVAGFLTTMFGWSLPGDRSDADFHWLRVTGPLLLGGAALSGAALFLLYVHGVIK